MDKMIVNTFTTHDQHDTAVFGFYPSRPKISYLVQPGQSKINIIRLGYDDVKALIAILDALGRIMETSLTSHQCHPTPELEIKWDGPWIHIRHTTLGDVISIQAIREKEKELISMLDNLINAMVDWTRVLESKYSIRDCESKFVAESKLRKPNVMAEVMIPAGAVPPEMLVFWLTKREPRKDLLIGNSREIIYRSAVDNQLAEISQGIDQVKAFADSLGKSDDGGKGIYIPFTSEFAVSGLHTVVFTELEPVGFNCLLVNQTFSQAGRVSWRCNRQDLDEIQVLLIAFKHF